MKLGIFWLGTSVYKNYFDEFSKSLTNLFPNGEFEKELVILSDGLQEYDGKQMFGCNVQTIEIIDYPYPLVTANKFQTVSHYMKKLNLDYGVFFDSDTIILEKSPEFWKSLKEKIISGKILCSSHPHYLYDRNYVIHPFLRIHNEFSKAYVDHTIIDSNKSYIISSFFAGSYKIITEYADKIYKMLGADLTSLRWMPNCVDEAYFNKIYVDEAISEGHTNMLKEPYITMNPYFHVGSHERSNENIYENNFPECDTIFMNQKYNLEIKNIKKTNQI